MEFLKRTTTSEYYERPDGIVVQKVVERRRHTIDDARKNIEAFNSIADGKMRRLVVDMAVAYSTGAGVRELYAEPESSRYIACLALVTHSTTTTMIGNFFMRINQPPYPCKLFNEMAAAVAWAMKHPV